METEGPAMIEQANTTLLVPPGYRLLCDEYRNYVMHSIEREFDEILADIGSQLEGRYGAN